MIEALTKKQEAELVEFRKECFEIGVNTDPVDKKTNSEIIDKFYAKIGKEKPQIYYFDSPLLCQLFLNLVKKDNKTLTNLVANLRTNLRTNLRDNLWDNLAANLVDNLRDNLWDNLAANLAANLGANLRTNLRTNLWDNLGANLVDNLAANLGANLRDNLRTNLWDNLWDNLAANLVDNLAANLGASLGANLEFFSTYLWGQQDIYWVGFYKFCEVIGIEYNKNDEELLNDWYNLSKSCMWWYPFENICVVSNRPKKINWDYENECLHSYNSPSVKFRDGWSIYNIDGVSVPEYFINDYKQVTLEKIANEENIELKRIMIQVYDHHRKPGAYLNDSGAVLIHKDNTGELYKKDMDDDEPIVMVKVVNSTLNLDGSADEYFLRVPPNIKTAKEAVAWTFEETVDNYQPVIES